MIESLVGGGLLGLLGSVVSNVTAFFKTKHDHKNAVELKKLDLIAQDREHKFALEQLEAEAKYRKDQLLIQSETDQSLAEQLALMASYRTDPAYTGDSRLLRIAEFIRRMTRPMLTFVLVFLTAGIYFSGDGSIRDLVARSVVAMTATAMAWWFADRQIAKQIAGRVL